MRDSYERFFSESCINKEQFFDLVSGKRFMCPLKKPKRLGIASVIIARLHAWFW